jgi:hypothetical protein
MTDTVQVAIVSGVFVLTGIIVTSIVTYQIAKLNTTQKALVTEFNGRMTELLELTKKISKQEGKDEQKQEDIDNDKK